MFLLHAEKLQPWWTYFVWLDSVRHPYRSYLVILESFSHRCRDGLRCFVPPELSAMTDKAACKGQGRSASQQRMGPSII
jgi:hypothetical protein